MAPAVTMALDRVVFSNLRHGTSLETRDLCEASSRGEIPFLRISPVPTAGRIPDSRKQQW